MSREEPGGGAGGGSRQSVRAGLELVTAILAGSTTPTLHLASHTRLSPFSSTT